jgi:rubrerythrin
LKYNFKSYIKSKNYIKGVESALFGELKAVKKYLEIRKELSTNYYRDILIEIITDELKHASKYNYLYSRNKKQ